MAWQAWPYLAKENHMYICGHLHCQCGFHKLPIEIYCSGFPLAAVGCIHVEKLKGTVNTGALNMLLFPSPAGANRIVGGMI